MKVSSAVVRFLKFQCNKVSRLLKTTKFYYFLCFCLKFTLIKVGCITLDFMLCSCTYVVLKGRIQDVDLSLPVNIMSTKHLDSIQLN